MKFYGIGKEQWNWRLDMITDRNPELGFIA